MLDDIAQNLDIDALDSRPSKPARDRADLLGKGKQLLHFVIDLSTLHVDRIGNEFSGERQTHRLGDGDTCLLLGFVGGRAEVRRGHDVLQREQG